MVRVILRFGAAVKDYRSRVLRAGLSVDRVGAL
jgi:hypothetical protein